MTDQHPITPPWDLKQQWREQAPRYRDGGIGRELWLMDRSAQWGADQELEGCIEVIESGRWFHNPVHRIAELRDARRPKAPSLKEQALEAAYRFYANNGHDNYNEKEIKDDFDIICRALEALPDD